METRPLVFDKSILGKTYGDLTILKIGRKKYPYGAFRTCFVKCICGNEKWIPFQDFKYAKYLNCGKKGCHWSVKKMIGKKFSRLTVISYHSRYVGYNCKCDCGNYTKATGWALKNGRHKSCGCYAIDAQVKRQTKPNFYSFKNGIYKNYQAAAKRKGYAFTISKKRFFHLIGKKCTYCGIPPNSKLGIAKQGIIDRSSFRYNGIDRVNNSRGYTKSNCVTCCHICNDSKKNLPLNDWKKWIRKIYNHQFKT